MQANIEDDLRILFVQDWNKLKDGDACIILTLEEGIVFKVIENHIREERKLRLISLNPVYEPYEITVVEIREIWKFTNYIGSEMPAGEISSSHLAQSLHQLKTDVQFIKDKISGPQ